MNDRTRLELLERILEAARGVVLGYGYVPPEDAGHAPGPRNIIAGLVRDIDALSAAPAKAEGETLRLAVWRNQRGSVVFDIAGSPSDTDNEAAYTRLGVVTLPIEKERRE